MNSKLYTKSDKKGDELFIGGAKGFAGKIYTQQADGSYKSQVLGDIKSEDTDATFMDIDKDGDLDVFVGTRLISGKYGFPPTSYLLINNAGRFTKAPSNIAPSLENIGMVTDAVFTDIDNDEDEDDLLKRTNLVLPRKKKPNIEDLDYNPKPTTPIEKISHKVPIPTRIEVPVHFPDFPNEKNYGKLYPGPREFNVDAQSDVTEFGKTAF